LGNIQVYTSFNIKLLHLLENDLKLKVETAKSIESKQPLSGYSSFSELTL